MLNFDMFFFKSSENFQQFEIDLCQANLLCRKAIEETKPKKILGIINLIGANFIFCKEFMVAIAWYMHNVSILGDEGDILDVTQVLKDMLEYYPRSPFCLFVLKKIYIFLQNHQFYNHYSDFCSLVELLEGILKEIGKHFPEDALKNLEILQKNLNLEKLKYKIYNTIQGINDQFILSINTAQTAILDETASDETKSIYLVILIYCLNKIKLPKLAEKYSNILKNKYPDVYKFLEIMNL